MDPWGLWGVQFGDLNLGVGNPSLMFDSSSWGDLGRGTAATIDGIIPYWKPLSGFYDRCDPIYRMSEELGAFSRGLLISAAVPSVGSWGAYAESPVLYEIGSTTVPTAVFEEMQGMTAIERGGHLLSQYGYGGIAGLSLKALAEGEFANTIGTGLTPGGWALLGAIQITDTSASSSCGCR